jgi:uncharacterized protein YhaN
VILAAGLAFGASPVAVLVVALLAGLTGWGLMTRLAVGGGLPGPLAATENRDGLLAERARLLEVAALPPNADPTAVAAAMTDVAVATATRREAEARRTRLAERREALERLEAEYAAAARARDAAEEEWQRWLVARSLPGDASPEAARQLLGAAQVGRRAAEQRDGQLRRAAAIREAAAAFDGRVTVLLKHLGRPAPKPGQTASALVIGLADELERVTAAHRRREELSAALEQQQRRRESLRVAASDADSALAGLLEQYDAADADELRSLAAAATQRAVIQQQCREQRAALVAIAGSQESLAALLQQARNADPAALTAQLDEAATETERLDEQIAEALTRDGALASRIEQLETADELGDARQQLAVAQAQAEEAAREWAVRALTLALLAETRHRYERERQPQVVQDAERYFATITNGRYPRIVAPPGETNVLVESEEGSVLTPDQLSRGTAEQLYLALRFGLIEQFARASEPLPVVMDDILVNFDPKRAERAARAIGQLASRHQVLFFTCHPRIAELLDPDGVVTHRLS